MDRTLLSNARLITMDDHKRQYERGALLVEDGIIKSIGQSDELRLAAGPETECIDLRGRTILPGLINTHVHTSQQLGRGIGDDIDLLTWLHKRIWPYESNLTEEDSYISSLLCGLEQIRSGVTCFAEPGGQFVSGMARAVSELGMRGILAKSTMDMGEGLPEQWKRTTQEELDTQIDNYERWHGKANERIRMWFGLRIIFNNSDELILKTKELADKFNVGIHMHVAEVKEEVEFALETRGATTVQHLNNLGVLDRNFLAVHCVYMTDEEIGIFADRDVKVSHCPASAMRLMGFARVPEMLDAGVCVTIATDGAPTNNRMTLIDEMWLTSLIHKGRKIDPTVLPAETVLAMVTSNAARAVLWEDEIGSLEEGKKADLVVVNPHSTGMLPVHDPVASLVSALRSENIESVMVDGQWLMREKEILSVDEGAILDEARSRAADIVRRAGIQLPPRFNIVD
jgi:5-methylthioadenosine/S-adenosylhomocysteine deaminase